MWACPKVNDGFYYSGRVVNVEIQLKGGRRGSGREGFAILWPMGRINLFKNHLNLG